ncbi:hypothetical protein FJZ41_02690 [Candidatus Shapirobacteria bacterium]|nr:hypothetical protein [Candidatus Shapirobacteria bacterium]
MNRKQKSIIIGMILGDAFLQKTGEKNARIRLEHSEKQKDYLIWKASFFPEFFQGKPSFLERFNITYQKAYRYVRWQSNASAKIGKMCKLFYERGRKKIPDNLPLIFDNPLALAIWYMDDGYLYHRDKIIYIYLPQYTPKEQKILLETLKLNFGLEPILKTKKKGNQVLIFPVDETKKFLLLVKPFIVSSMKYKLLDPVSTEA